MSDNLRPDYYNQNGIEVFDIIRAFGLDFFEGNAIKYLLRKGKGNRLQDLIKARTYIDQLIATEEAKANETKNI